MSVLKEIFRTAAAICFMIMILHSPNGNILVQCRRQKRSIEQTNQPLEYQHNPHEFSTIVAHPLFVDKTLFIKHFLNIREQFYLVAPPSFGKSTNIHMLKYFFQIPVDGTGANITSKISEKAHFFSNLSICQTHPTICETHMSQSPVIFLDFQNINGTTAASCFESFKSEVNRMFNAHAYLAKSPALTESERDEFEAFATSDSKPKRIIGFYKRGVEVLVRLLWSHYNRKCMIFIDNFDKMAVEVVLGKNKLLPMEVDQIYFALSKIAKHTPEVDRTFLTGVFRLGSAQTWYRDNLYYHSIFDDPFIAAHYGLSLTDLQDLLKRLGRDGDPDDLERIQYHYDGYNIVQKQLKIFNTGSIISYLEGEGVKIPSQQLVLALRPLFRFELLGEYLADALENGAELAPKWLIAVTDLAKLRIAILDDVFSFGEGKNKEVVLQLLVEAGYLSAKERLEDGWVRLVVPCSAVKEDFEQLVYSNEYFVTHKELEEERAAEKAKNTTEAPINGTSTKAPTKTTTPKKGKGKQGKGKKGKGRKKKRN